MSVLAPLVNQSTESRRVLHVDDDPDFADLTATFLEREDDAFTVETATTVDAGLARLEAQGFDCIVSDYELSGRNGVEFLEAVRETDPDLPFILFTGKGSEEVASDAISAGVTDYLQKEGGTDQYTVLANRIANAIDHHRSQQVVAQSERRLRDIIDALPQLLYVVDANGRYLLANETLAAFHGTTVEALEGATVDDVLEGRQAEQFRSELSAVLDSGTKTACPEMTVPDAEGELHVLEPCLLPYHLGDPDERAVLGFAVDVTDRHRRERELERTRERMQLALEHTDSVVFEIDLHTEVVTRYGAYGQFFDLTDGEAPTWEDHLERAVHPDDQPAFRRFYRGLVDGEHDGGDLEYRTHPDRGPIRWIRDAVSVEAESADGSPLAVGIARDVTRYKERELTLREQERRYRAVFNDPNILVGLLETDGTVIDINRTAMNYVDADLADVTGGPFWETPWFEHSAAVRAEVESWIERAAGGEYVEFEADLVRPDGEPYMVEGVFRPVLDDDGKVVSLLVSDREITERKVREDRLRDTTSRLQVLFENSPDMIDVIDPEGTVVDVNARFCEELGYDEAEVLGQPIWAFDQLVDAEDVTALLADFTAGERRRFEGRYERADGTSLPVEVHLLRLELDGRDRFMAISRDITERKRHEQVITGLHGSAETILRAETDECVAEIMVDAVRDILEMPLNGVCFHDPTAGVLRPVTWTEEGTAVVGDPPTFSPGGSLAWDVFETGETQRYDDVSVVPGRLNPETPIRSEIIVPLGDYGVAMIGSTEVGAFDAVDVSLVETLATHAVTALNRIARERELQESEARYRSLTDDVLDTSRIATFILNADFEVVWITQATEEYFGIDRNEVVGADKRRLIDDDIKHIFEDAETFADTVLATYDDNTYVEEFECHVVGGDGREDRWLHHWSQPIESGLYAGGRIEHYTDVTERKRHEQDLQTQNDRLEEFASVVSHDLRNPLSVAVGRLELARDACDSDELDVVARAHDRMGLLIDDLLSLARDGVSVRALEPVDLAVLAETCWGNVEQVDARLRVTVDRPFMADRSRLQQLLENLMRNAIEHGGEDVSISIGPVDHGFYVEDDGPGIPPDERETVFEPGYSSSEDGTGFGLSIVNQIAGAHGWTVAVTAGSTGGARFEVTGVEFTDG